MVIAIVLVLIVVGSVAFHMLSPWWWTPIASNWGYIDTTLVVTFWITGIVFVMVVLFLAYCVFAFRHREGHKAVFDPENKRLEVWLTVITAIGVAALLVPGLFVWKQFVTVPDNATEVEVVAQQWSWNYRLPGEDGRLGTSAVEHISDENPLGINPFDRFGKDDVIIEGGELYLPKGQPVKMLLRSIDVLHNYYVPEFRAKMDMVPGMVTFYWFTPTRIGEFEVLCAEFCGTAHGFMRGDVYVVSPEEYQEWLSEQDTFADYAAAAKPEQDTQIAHNSQP
ncbi:cytochrome c oxidase subunit II [Parasedimentitalea maritima]|uniref:cytochrome-c oxidase n=1 Tax=Parasedimentitalea maritima TaxID=2578117 RepID=A0A5R8ZSD5_9RHOB|nr:cytochrome c oxidase subunit II [Zongyanglinia marina]KAE9632823.1 cytochrome-c oxidase [Zongyanglinia marina]TLP69327.1 cytochrome c oxidase subunit II [Zongyanglinia marina]